MLTSSDHMACQWFNPFSGLISIRTKPVRLSGELIEDSIQVNGLEVKVATLQTCMELAKTAQN
jgi:hypothetical protein